MELTAQGSQDVALVGERSPSRSIQTRGERPLCLVMATCTKQHTQAVLVARHSPTHNWPRLSGQRRVSILLPRAPRSVFHPGVKGEAEASFFVTVEAVLKSSLGRGPRMVRNRPKNRLRPQWPQCKKTQFQELRRLSRATICPRIVLLSPQPMKERMAGLRLARHKGPLTGTCVAIPLQGDIAAEQSFLSSVGAT